MSFDIINRNYFQNHKKREQMIKPTHLLRLSNNCMSLGPTILTSRTIALNANNYYNYIINILNNEYKNIILFHIIQYFIT